MYEFIYPLYIGHNTMTLNISPCTHIIGIEQKYAIVAYRGE